MLISRVLGVGCCALLIVPVCWAGVEAPVTVSPGASTGALIGDVCPTFSWGAVPDARTYELVVYRLGNKAEEAESVLMEQISGSALGWTPPLNQCLKRGGRYAWSVRAVGGREASGWSSPSFFEVASGKSQAELEEALALVRQYFVTEGGAELKGIAEAEPRSNREASPSSLGAPAAGVVGTPQLSVDGGIEATSFTGDGSTLTDLDPTELLEGTADISITGTATPSGTAGGDLAGTYPDPTVVDAIARDAEVSAAVAAHKILPNDHHTPPTSLPPGGAASGDLAGTYPAPTVVDAIARDAEVSALLGGLSLCPAAVGSTDRFTDCGNGTVRDNNTGLIWLQDASCAALPGTTASGMADWADANAAAAALADGTCGLTDGSQAGDWRLPEIGEFCSEDNPTPTIGVCPTGNAVNSLVNTNFGSPALSNAAGVATWDTDGDAFIGVLSNLYWSVNENENDPDRAWYAHLNDGSVTHTTKVTFLYVWPVRAPFPACADGLVQLGDGSCVDPATQAELDTHAGVADAHRDHATLEESAEIDADIATHASAAGVHHTKTVDTDTLAGLACADGKVPKWSDSLAQWECAADQTADTAGLEEQLCRLYLQTGQLPYPDFCDVEPVSGSVDITGQPVVQVDLNPVTDRVYIGSNYSLSLQPLTVIDVSDKTNPTVVTTLTGSGATVNPATNRFYAKGGTGFSGTFLVYNGVDNSLITTVPVGYCGGRLDTDATTNMIYMTSECGGGNDPLHVLNGATDTLAAGPLFTGGIVGSVVVNSATGNAYVARTGGTRVFGPPPGFAVITDLAGISCGAVNPVTNRIYCGSSGNLEVRSGVDHSLITTIAGVAGTIGVNTARDRIYFSDGPAELIRVVDGDTNTVIGDISLGAGVTPGNGAVDSTKNRIYVGGTSSAGTRLYVVTDTVP